jgi:hypothetical protein
VPDLLTPHVPPIPSEQPDLEVAANMRTLPLPELTEPQNELVRQAFLALLNDGRPVSEAQLTAATGQAASQLHHQLDVLTTAGRIRRNSGGDVTGSLGLTLDTTRHELVIDASTWHTWCAIDALGILGALEASGTIRSTSPWTGQLIEIHFADGGPVRGDLSSVVYLATYPAGSSVVDNWCPNVNLFESETTATQWAKGSGVRGNCLPLDDACTLAAHRWRERLQPDTTS